ncbi:MAG: EAL domain-containing protein [Nitriliruptoraceae bacterium]
MTVESGTSTSTRSPEGVKAAFEATSAGLVLVVDDDPAVRSLVTDVLRGAGHEVLTAADATSALAVCATHVPDLAIVDIVLPGIDGVELCSRLRNQEGNEHLPVLFLSALNDAGSKARAFAAGAVDYLPKPFRREELLARARAHLVQSQARAELRARHAALSDEATAALAVAASAEAQLSSLLRAVPDAVFLKDPDGRYLDCNAAAARRLGREPGEVIGHRDDEFLPAPIVAELREISLQAAAKPSPVTIEQAIPGPEGGTTLWESTLTAVRGANGELLGLLGIARDVTDRHERQRAREAEQARLNDALEAAQAGTWELDVRTGRIQVSARWLKMLGERSSSGRQVDLDAWQERVHPEDRADLTAALHALIQGASERLEAEYRIRHETGRWLWQRDLARAAEREADGRARLIRGLVLDVTQELAHREQLDFAAAHDGLTGLSNRQRFSEHLRKQLEGSYERGDRLAVVTIDLDGFEAVNTLHGRAAGNQLLVELAMRLVDHVGDRTLVGRVGGDEFSVILHDGQADLQDRLEELHAVVSKPVQQQGRSIHATASIGATLVPQARRVDADQLLRQADQAVYQAKLAGKDRYHVFDPADDAKTRERYVLFSEIERALAEDELVLHYQPQVHLRTGEVFGVEALIRWQHPERGLLLPGAFIPQIAGHPLSIEVGDRVIEMALAQLAAWQGDGWDTTISVNVDAAQLYDPGFVDRLESQLAAFPTVRPDQLGLEVLETGALVDLSHVSRLLTRLHTLGFSTSLDDFGTGFSSLTLLKQLPADVIKIDRSFVIQVLDDPQHAVIIESIVALCRSFNRTVLGEGVESEEHGRVLLELGCDRAQGFGIARPMPAADLAGWRDTWTPPPSWRTANVLPEDRVPGLIAELEHRLWLQTVESFLDGEDVVTPPVERTACRLGRWLLRERDEVRARELDDIDQRHRLLHEEASRLVAEHRRGHTEPPDDRALLRHRSQELVAALRAWRADRSRGD